MLNNRYIRFTLALIAVLILLPQADLQAQCAMCKAAAETSMKSNPGSMARSLNSGILYLMAVPYLLIMFLFRKQIAQLWKSRFGKAARPDANNQ